MELNMNKFDSEEAERTSKFYVMFGNKLDSLVNEMKKKARSNDTSSKAAEVAMAIYAVWKCRGIISSLFSSTANKVKQAADWIKRGKEVAKC